MDSIFVWTLDDVISIIAAIGTIAVVAGIFLYEIIYCKIRDRKNRRK